MSIKWYRSKDGFKESKCGRFEIVPKFFGSTTPQAYTLDYKPEKETIITVSRYNETQKEAMEDAEDYLERIYIKRIYKE